MEYFFPVSSRGDVALPRIFGDHMVLQGEGTVPIWGTAAPGEVPVTAGQTHGTATAGADGKWMVKLAGLPGLDHSDRRYGGG